VSTLTVTPTLPAGTWSVDPVHSSIGFGVKHLGISTFRGSFPVVSGTLVTADGTLRSVEGAVEVGSVTTQEPQLTGHLQSPDFFDAAAHPQITFRSTGVTVAGEDRLRVAGDLTIRGIARPVVIDATVEGVVQDPYGTTRVGIEGTAAIDRAEWGITFNIPLANGALAIGEKVTLTLHVEATLGEAS
jgi:polyisoprenoid-binding protein YceI